MSVNLFACVRTLELSVFICACCIHKLYELDRDSFAESNRLSIYAFRAQFHVYNSMAVVVVVIVVLQVDTQIQ